VVWTEEIRAVKKGAVAVAVDPAFERVDSQLGQKVRPRRLDGNRISARDQGSVLSLSSVDFVLDICLGNDDIVRLPILFERHLEVVVMVVASPEIPEAEITRAALVADVPFADVGVVVPSAVEEFTERWNRFGKISSNRIRLVAVVQ